MGQQSHVLILKYAFEILIVSALVGSQGAGFGRCDRFAGHGMINGTTLGVGVGARNAKDRDRAIGRHAIKLVVLAVGRGGNATKVIFIGIEDRLGSAPDGGAIFMKGEFV